LKIAEAHLQSLSPYSQSGYYNKDIVPELPKELQVDYEKRTWKERCHTRQDGHIFISPMAFTNSLKDAAKYLGVPIPGKSRQTFTKHFESGVLVTDPLVLKETKDTVEGEWLFVPSDGRRGGGRRVEKCFPLIQEWSGVVNYVITQDVFRQVLETSGSLIGIGRFRPRNLGYYGRFKLTDLKWIEDKK
jgi:hypothetical protein